MSQNEKVKTAIIICNGSIKDYSQYRRYLEQADIVICVDGGARHAKMLGTDPDILLGDFDSISPEELEQYEKSSEMIRFPVQKDMTDTELAIETAIIRGYKSIILIGALGSRADHSLSNVFLLKKILLNGASGIIANENNEITLIQDRIQINNEENLKVTLLPLTETVIGVSIKGFCYPLENATLCMGSSWGVSNEIVGQTAEIKIKDGLLLVIKSRD